MYKEKKILCFTAIYNELHKIDKVLSKINHPFIDEILVIDDGSTDGSPEVAKNMGANVISLGNNYGAGYTIQRAVKYALAKKFDIIVMIAGNNKDDPDEIDRLLRPIYKDGYDFVQGSRFLKGGRYGKMPIYRLLGVKLHRLLFSIVSRKKVTESTNGFRAMKLSIFEDKNINIWQNWLNRYDLEPYLYYKVIKLGYKIKEVPVSKIYPPKELGYTKMKPIVGWWSIFRPLIFLAFGLRKK